MGWKGREGKGGEGGESGGRGGDIEPRGARNVVCPGARAGSRRAWYQMYHVTHQRPVYQLHSIRCGTIITCDVLSVIRHASLVKVQQQQRNYIELLALRQ